MEFIRSFVAKTLVVTALFVLILMAGPMVAAAEDFPSKPITLVAGYTAGGATGKGAYVIAEGMKKYLPNPQPVRPLFKPGAATSIAGDYVMKQPADGYTLYILTPGIYGKFAKEPDKLSYTTEDIIPIGIYGFTPHFLGVSKERSPFKTFEEFLDFARKNPEGLSVALTGGIGSSSHLSNAMFMDAFGIKLNLIPFAGWAPSATALLGGHVDCVITSPASAGDQIKQGGGVRVLTFLSPERWPDLPDVLTCAERGYKLDRGYWCGLAVKKGTPQPVLDILQRVYKQTTNDPKVKEGLFRVGFLPWDKGPEETKKIAAVEFKQAKEFYKKLGLIK